MAEIAPFFAVPFGFARLDDCAPLNEQLRETFLQRAALGAAYANPRPITRRNQQVYESRFDLFRWPEAPVQHLKEFCWRELIRWVCELNRYDDKVRAQLCCTRTRGFTSPGAAVFLRYTTTPWPPGPESTVWTQGARTYSTPTAAC